MIDATPALMSRLRSWGAAGVGLLIVAIVVVGCDAVTSQDLGDADPQTARLFRAMGDDLDAQLARATERLEAACGDDAAWERAREAAAGAIEAAYEEYTDRLESLGVNPKPVC